MDVKWDDEYNSFNISITLNVNEQLNKTKSLYTSLTIETVETGPNKLVVVRDFVDNSTQTADAVLYNL